MSNGTDVVVDGISKRFVTEAGDVLALRDVSLDVGPGTSLAITGASGCGKSTLLSLVGGLEAPSTGRVSIGGTALSELPERDRARFRRRHIGFVFQSHNLQPFLTAEENVGLQLALTGAENGYERCLSLLDRLGLAAAAGKYPDQLSGGERQRIAVARALVHGPSLLLADEPTGALDRETSLAVIELLIESQTSLGATLLVVTHDPAIAERLDRTVRLRDGELVGDSTPFGHVQQAARGRGAARA